MEKLKAVDVFLDFNDGTVKGKGFVDNFLQGVAVNIFAEECLGHVEGNVAKRHVCHVVEEYLRHLVDAFGHIETAVFCQSLYHGFLQVGHGGLFIGAVVFHKRCFFILS